MSIRNPQGALTDELYEAVKTAYKKVHQKQRVLMIVDGEEDLAFLPCLLEAEEKWIVCYGQPDEGIVVVEPTPTRKRFIKRSIEKMEA